MRIPNHDPLMTSKERVRFAAILAALFIVMVSCSSCSAPQLAGDVPSTMDAPVAKLVQVTNGETSGYCTVFKVGDNLAMTAGHCCDPSTDKEIVTYHAVGPHAVPGAGFEILYDDDTHDVCVMKGEMKGAPLTMALHDPVLGARVWTAGYPQTHFLISEGLWSGRDEGGEGMASIAVWGGASGSPVMDNQGRVIGVLRAFYPTMSNMAVIAPIEWVRAAFLRGRQVARRPE